MDYQEQLADEAKHWDEFERDIIEGEKLIPWWLDLRNASSVKKNTNAGLNPVKEKLIRGKYKQVIIDSCRPGDYVLDVGCGSGWLSLELARKGCRVVGIDVSSYRINLAKKYYQRIREQEGLTGSIDYRCGDIGDLRLDDKIDVIAAWDSLHHLPDLDRLFAGFKGQLKPDGLLVCYDHLGSRFIEVLGKIRRLFVKEKVSAFEDVSQDEIIYFLRKHFNVIQEKYKISAPFRLISFLLLRFDLFIPLISILVKIDEFIANRIKIFGREFVFIKCKNYERKD